MRFGLGSKIKLVFSSEIFMHVNTINYVIT